MLVHFIIVQSTKNSDSIRYWLKLNVTEIIVIDKYDETFYLINED